MGLESPLFPQRLEVSMKAWFLWAFFCIGTECVTMSSVPTQDLEECVQHRDRMVKELILTEGITAYHVQCRTYEEPNP